MAASPFDALTGGADGAKTTAMQGMFRIARQLAFIALVARALVPGGWMPDAHGLTICSVNLGAIHHDSGPSPHGGQHDNKAAHGECPFAASAQMVAAPEAPSLALPGFHAFAAITARHYAAAVAARFLPQSPRAPPLNA
jgi:hypothetical protein